MTSNSILQFYEALGFEQAEQEDGTTELFFILTHEGNYALITDENGAMPENLDQTIIFAYYTLDDSFQWSTSFKDSHQFQEIWSSGQTLTEKRDAVLRYREKSGYYNLSV